MRELLYHNGKFYSLLYLRCFAVHEQQKWMRIAVRYGLEETNANA